MKPIQINMQYFGPFENQTIDFDDVSDSMFLISGRTGSGKTMIFDAITYALYGTLSTSDRAEGSVRSQFATDDDISAIRLSFEIRGRRYTIERTLSYQKAGRKTPVPPKAVLYDADGKVLEGSINGVKSMILEILQLNADQFRQILILPQGEFKRLLTSSSEQKQEILRTLFRTERFVKFEHKLNELKKEKLKGSEMVETKIAERFNTITGEEHPEVAELLKVEFPTFARRMETIDKVQAIIEKRKAEVERALVTNKDRLDTLGEVLKKKKDNNARIEEVEKIKTNLASLEDDASRIQSLETEIESYRTIKEMEYTLRTESGAREQKSRIETELSDLKTQFSRVDKALEVIGQKHGELQEKSDFYQRAETWLNTTERFMHNEEIENIHETMASLKARKSEISKENSAISEKLEAVAETLGKDAWNREQSEQLSRERYAVDNEISALEQAIGTENELRQYDAEKATLTDVIKKIDQKHARIESERKEKQDALKSRYSAEDGAHIEHLIGHLEVGAPCPVCQQTVQALPEAHQYLSAEEEEAFRALEADLEALSNDRSGKARRLDVVDALLADKTRKDLDALNASLEEYRQKEKDLKQRIEEEKRRFEEKQQLEKQQNTLNSRLNDNRLEQNNVDHKLSHAESLLSEFRSQTSYDDYRTFAEMHHKCQRSLEDYKAQVKENEQKQLQYREQKSRLEEKLSYLQKQLDEVAEQLRTLSPEIDAFAGRMNSDRSQMLTLLERSDIQSVEQTVKEHHSRKSLLETRQNVLMETLESESMQDTAEEQNEIEQLTAQNETLTNQRVRLETQLEQNRKTADSISKLIAEYEAALGEIQSLIELVDVVSGRNEQKVSLERYVLTYYLDRILDIANIRLLEMTNHRYELRRSTNRSNRKTGLDIEVFDFYNNRSRHITSLSGGESFQAALTLALAMNEALQQESGGISLDTMLIDEGFGTLDPETLDMAVNTLIELQTSGKMVGIISHVEELKERMENILEVSAVNERSTARFK
ncbi:AAA family ATPase [Salinicoccus hispanicus]|uniref:Nuclease SbcCD subunit C n=1 Tax=Salinicoccus hispanicus TaxID=157225 RepID=A0A6N8TY80_9STAP|nr:SMC family ATPase [Salinicoccus hispanicus]MXQ49957.1 AAA family ATPase [Salinicoccus hispanicus]